MEVWSLLMVPFIVRCLTWSGSQPLFLPSVGSESYMEQEQSFREGIKPRRAPKMVILSERSGQQGRVTWDLKTGIQSSGSP